MKPVYCPSCKRTCIPNDNTCPYCGKTIDTTVEDEYIVSSEKVMCEFCGSFIEPEEGKCPNCGANLGESIRLHEQQQLKAAQRRKEKEQEELEAAEKAKEQEETDRQLMEIAENVIASAAGNKGGLVGRIIKRNIRKLM